MLGMFKVKPIKQPTALKIALVGSVEAKNTFINKLKQLARTENTTGFQQLLGVDFISATILHQPYIFWNLTLSNENNAVLISAFDGANAVLFCDASSEQQTQVRNILDGDLPNMIHIKPDSINLSHFLTDLNRSIKARNTEPQLDTLITNTLI